MLKEALKSVEQINFPSCIKVEVLVCDNDINESGKKVIEKFAQNSKFKIHYVVEEERGIAFARNKILKEAIKRDSQNANT